MTPITLHESDDARVVQLSGDYSTNWGSSIDELKAVLYTTGYVELHRFRDHESGEITRFTLSEEEVATFFGYSRYCVGFCEIFTLATKQMNVGYRIGDGGYL